MFARYVIMIVILITAGWLFYPQKSPPPPPTIPKLSFSLPNGEATSLQNYRGKTTLIHFWASWCPPCLPEMPELIELAKTHPEELTILAFSLDRTEKDMQRFLKVKFGTLPPNFIAIWDEKGSIARETFHSFNYPESYILSCDGTLRDKIIGAANDWKKEIRPHLEACEAP